MCTAGCLGSVGCGWVGLGRDRCSFCRWLASRRFSTQPNPTHPTTMNPLHVPSHPPAGDRRLLIKYRPAKKAAVHLRALGLVDEEVRGGFAVVNAWASGG